MAATTDYLHHISYPVFAIFMALDILFFAPLHTKSMPHHCSYEVIYQLFSVLTEGAISDVCNTRRNLYNQHIKLSSLPLLDSIWFFLQTEPVQPEMKLVRITRPIRLIPRGLWYLQIEVW